MHKGSVCLTHKESVCLAHRVSMPGAQRVSMPDAQREQSVQGSQPGWPGPSSSSSSAGPRVYAPDAPQPIGLLCDPCPPVIFRRSHFRRQVPPCPYDVRDPSSERWDCGQECWPVMSTSTFHLGIFYMPQIWDMAPTALLPLRRKACWGFFHPEKSWQLQPGLNPRTWVLKGSTQP